jgi:predicted flap endonuclease-1-like 5' DNA nuclease
MQDDETSRSLWVSAAVGLAALIVLFFLAGYGFWPALLWGLVVSAVAALLMWALRDRGETEPVADDNPWQPAAPTFVGTAAVEPTSAELGSDGREGAVAPPYSRVAAGKAVPPAARTSRPRKAADSMARDPRRDRSRTAAAPASPSPATADPRAKAGRSRATDRAPSVPVKTASAEAAPPDDLKAIKGIGPKIEGQLHALGVTTYAQIAAWTAADIERVEGEFGFPGRIGRDGWVAQAAALAAKARDG